MKLTEKQIKIINGWVCSYCGQDAEICNLEEVFHGMGKGPVAVCRQCGAWVPAEEKDGALIPCGRVAKADIRSLKDKIAIELSQLYKNDKEKEKMIAALSSYLGIPIEHCSIHKLGGKSFVKIMEFCMMNKEISGSKIEWTEINDDCPEKKLLKPCSSACRGCPHYILDNKIYVWCNKDMCYGNMSKKKENKNG